VLDSDPKTSLAKSPNAQLVALYTTRQADFSSGQAAWGIGHRVYAVGGWRSASLEVGGTIQQADCRFSTSSFLIWGGGS